MSTYTNFFATLENEKSELIVQLAKEHSKQLKDCNIKHILNFLAFWVFYDCGIFFFDQSSSITPVEKNVYSSRLKILEKIIHKKLGAKKN